MNERDRNRHLLGNLVRNLNSKSRKLRQKLTLGLVTFGLLFALGQGDLLSENPLPSFGEGARTVQEVEALWAGQYNDHFERKFPSLSLSAEAISDRLSQLVPETGQRAAVLWINMQPEKTTEILILPDRQILRQDIKAANQDQLLAVVNRFFYHLLQPTLGDQSAYLPDAQQLHRWLIDPIEPTLQSQRIDTLLFCLGPRLRSLPLAALHDGGQFLIQKYNLTRIPAFNLINLQYNPLQNAEVLAMGASTFVNLSPLPGVALEVQTITPGLWSGTALLNQEFTLANLIEQQQTKPHAIVHLATHAQFNPGMPDRSFIQFAKERLTLSQIPQLNWQRSKISLLVLSACETALGDRQAELGFAGLALQAGVQSAIASLWPVSDLGTLALMSEFYQQLKTAPTKAAALRQAQVAMIEGRVKLEGSDLRNSRTSLTLPEILTKNAPKSLSHPFYWSSFSLIGSPW